MKIKAVFYLILLLFVFGFAAFVWESENDFVENEQNALNRSSDVISEAVWTLFTPATKSYVENIFDDRKYRSLKITSVEDYVVMYLETSLNDSFSKTLQSIGLIRTVKLSSAILHDDDEIGVLECEVFNLLIYRYIYTFILSVCVLSVFWFGIKLYEAKNELEDRVGKRTDELNLNKQRLSFALLAAGSGIWHWNLKTNEVYFDENYYKIAGYLPNSFPCAYEEWNKRLYPEDRPKVEAAVKDYLDGITDYFSIEFRFLKANGDWMWILAQGKVVEYDKYGKPYKFTGTHTDINKSKIVEEELRESEARYYSLFRNNHSIMLLIDPFIQEIVDANPAALKFYGWEKFEILGKKLKEIDVTGEQKITDQLNLANTEKKKEFLTRHLLANGETRDVEIFSGPIIFKDKRYIFSIVHDVTNKIKAEEKLRELNENLTQKVNEELDRNRKQEEIIHNQKKLADMGNMISAISHQWRQPLTALGLNIQDVAEAFESMDIDEDYIKEFEKESMSLISFLSATIDDFRYFFQPDKEEEDFKIIDEIMSLSRLTQAQLQSNYIKLIVNCSCPGDCLSMIEIGKDLECSHDNTLVKGYKGEFKQVIVNIIYNAIDSINETKKNNQLKQGLICVNVCDDGKFVTVEIEDNGGGVDPYVAGRIFDPYFTTKEEGKGTGIGLYMSKVIIEDHMNGKISFDNTGSGAKFIIKIPSTSNS